MAMELEKEWAEHLKECEVCREKEQRVLQAEAAAKASEESAGAEGGLALTEAERKELESFRAILGDDDGQAEERRLVQELLEENRKMEEEVRAREAREEEEDEKEVRVTVPSDLHPTIRTCFQDEEGAGPAHITLKASQQSWLEQQIVCNSKLRVEGEGDVSEMNGAWVMVDGSKGVFRRVKSWWGPDEEADMRQCCFFLAIDVVASDWLFDECALGSKGGSVLGCAGPSKVEVRRSKIEGIQGRAVKTMWGIERNATEEAEATAFALCGIEADDDSLVNVSDTIIRYTGLEQFPAVLVQGSALVLLRSSTIADNQVGVEVSDSATVRLSDTRIHSSALGALRGREEQPASTLEMSGCVVEGPFIWCTDARPGKVEARNNSFPGALTLPEEMVVALAESEALMGMDPGELQEAEQRIFGAAQHENMAPQEQKLWRKMEQALDFEGRTPSCSPPPSEEEGEEERARARGEERERGEDVRMRGVGEEGGDEEEEEGWFNEKEGAWKDGMSDIVSRMQPGMQQLQADFDALSPEVREVMGIPTATEAREGAERMLKMIEESGEDGEGKDDAGQRGRRGGEEEEKRAAGDEEMMEGGEEGREGRGGKEGAERSSVEREQEGLKQGAEGEEGEEGGREGERERGERGATRRMTDAGDAHWAREGAEREEEEEREGRKVGGQKGRRRRYGRREYEDQTVEVEGARTQVLGGAASTPRFTFPLRSDAERLKAMFQTSKNTRTWEQSEQALRALVGPLRDPSYGSVDSILQAAAQQSQQSDAAADQRRTLWEAAIAEYEKEKGPILPDDNNADDDQDMKETQAGEQDEGSWEEAMGKVQEAFPLVFDKFLARLQATTRADAPEQDALQ